jgi:general secretion pathway protein D
VFTVDVVVSDVVDLFAFQFDVEFDPAIVAATGITEGPFLAGGGPALFIPAAIDNIGGSIDGTVSTLLGVVGVSGTGVLASVQFISLAVGVSPISLSGVTLFDLALAPIDATTVAGAVDVTLPPTVPEPSTWVLLGAGFVVLRQRGYVRVRRAR